MKAIKKSLITDDASINKILITVINIIVKYDLNLFKNLFYYYIFK